MILKERIYEQARLLGACTDELSVLNNCKSEGDMLRTYMDNIRYCLFHNFPSPSFIKVHFQKAAREHGVFIDEQMHWDNLVRGVFLGRCNAKLSLTGNHTGRYYARQKSRVFINASGRSSAIVTLYDQAKVIARPDENALIHVFRVGGGDVIEDPRDNGRIKITDIDPLKYLKND